MGLLPCLLLCLILCLIVFIRRLTQPLQIIDRLLQIHRIPKRHAAKMRINVNLKDVNGKTLLLYAAQSEPVPNLNSLDKWGCDWRVKSKTGCTVIHYAAEGGNIQAIKYFVALGANIEARNCDGNTPLLCVINAINFLETVNELVNLGANINARNKFGENILHYAVMKEPVDVLASLVKMGCDWRVKNKLGKTVLHYAAGGGNVPAIKYFVALGANIKARDYGSYTPLLSAVNAKTSFLNTVRTLVNLGANINATDNKERNLLLLAIQNGRSLTELHEIVRLGGNWKVKTKDGCSILHYAVCSRNLEIVKYFIGLGADVNLRDENGKTPVHCSYQFVSSDNYSNTYRMVRLLAENGADINAVTKYGYSVLKVLKSLRESDQMIGEFKPAGGNEYSYTVYLERSTSLLKLLKVKNKWIRKTSGK